MERKGWPAPSLGARTIRSAIRVCGSSVFRGRNARRLRSDGSRWSYHPQKEYLQLLEAFCREHDIVFILDEVQANFGRTGPMYAYTHYGVEPDIVVLGKGMGNGVPVDAAVGRADLFAKLTYG